MKSQTAPNNLSQQQINQAVIHFLMANLVSANPKVVAQYINDQRLDDGNANPPLKGQKAIKQFHDIRRTIGTREELYDLLAHCPGVNPHETIGGGNAHEVIGDTLIHIIVKYKHYALLNKIMNWFEAHYPNDETPLKVANQLLNLTNHYGETVCDVLDHESLQTDQDLHESRRKALLDTAKTIQTTPKKSNDQRETQSCKFVSASLNYNTMESQLHTAAREQNLVNLALFLREGMDPNVYSHVDSIQMETPLHSWVNSSNPQPDENVLTLLMQHGADLESTTKTTENSTALELALENGGARSTQFFVPLLLTRGARLTNLTLKNLLVLVHQSKQTIQLNLSQLDIIDPTFMPDKNQIGAQLYCAYQVIIQQKHQHPNSTVNVYDVIDGAQQTVQNQLQTTKQQMVKTQKKIAQLQKEIADAQAQQKLTQKQQREQTQTQQQPEQKHQAQTSSTSAPPANIATDKNDVTNNNTDAIDITVLQAAFKASKFHTEIFKPKVIDTLTVMSKNTTLRLATKLELVTAIDEINAIVDTQLKASNTTTFDLARCSEICKAIINFIETDLVNRDPIKQQPFLIKWLKRIVGGLLAFITAGIPLYKKDSRERFTARFFSSPATYELTLMKQALASEATQLEVGPHTTQAAPRISGQIARQV